MFDDLMTASEARNKIQKNTERLCNKVENAILIAISENKLDVDCYLTVFEYSLISDKLGSLGYVLTQKDKFGSSTYRFTISW